MGFLFNPLFLFVCRVCKETFPDTSELKQHKLEHHLGDCLNTKCIIFEERCVDHDYRWNPGNNSHMELNLNKDATIRNRNEDRNFQFCTRKKSFINPCVSLKRLTTQELGDAVNNFATDAGQGFPRQKRRFDNSHTSGSSFENNYDNEYVVTASKQIKFNAKEYTEQIPVTSGFNKTSIYENLDPIDNSVYIQQDEFILPTTVDPQDFEFDLNIPTSVPIQFLQHENDPSILDQVNSYQQENEPFCKAEITCYSNETNPFCDVNQLPAEDEDSVTSQTESDFPFPTISKSFSLEQPEPESERTRSLTLNIISSSLNHQQEITSSPWENQDQDVVERPFSCQICFGCFRTKQNLIGHMRTHSDERPFKCPHCSADFKHQSLLKRHLITHGLLTTNFKCTTCGKSFLRREELQDHERSHTGERPFKCQISNCDATFCSKNAMRKHVRSKHSEELGLQLSKCPNCDKTFGFQHELKNHILISHSQDRPFKCPKDGCTMDFKFKQHLHAHIKNKHKGSGLSGVRRNNNILVKSEVV